MVTLRNNFPRIYRCQERALCSLPPLNEPLDTPDTKNGFLKVPAQNETVRITTLSNGLKVASENSFGQFSTVGGKKILFFLKVLKFQLYFMLPFLSMANWQPY